MTNIEKITIIICIFVTWFIYRPYIEFHKDKIVLFYWWNNQRITKIYKL